MIEGGMIEGGMIEGGADNSGTQEEAARRQGGAAVTQAEPQGDLTLKSINTVRTLAMDAVQAANSGHPGTPMGLAPLAVALWTHGMKYSSAAPTWMDRDRFVLSCGHASMLQYAMLHLTGYDLSLEAIRNFRQLGSPAAGHPEYREVPGVETTTGPLGQGMGNAVGMALAERMLAARYNRDEDDGPLVDHRTWVIASDGDLMEGVASEAASLAGHLRLSKLCVFWDDNRITIDGGTDLSFSEDVAKRFESYGWNIEQAPFEDGLTSYQTAIDAAIASDRPTLVVCRTHIGFGSPNKQDKSAAHGAALGEDEVRLTKRALGWPEDATFLVPDDVKAFLTKAGRRGDEARGAWDERVERIRRTDSARVTAFERDMRGALPTDWEAALPDLSAEPGSKGVATRKSSGAVLAGIADVVPSLIGGSCDLAGSNNTTIPGASDVTADNFAARTLHFGVREHAMGAMMNGMALHGGVRPYGGTFLVFSDYMRASIRLAALMRLPVIYVFTHDSIGVGEDGPTHQPVEHLAALRTIPGLDVWRPADGPETVEAWRAALKNDGPSALILTRQGLAPIDRTRAPSKGAQRGAYIVREGAVEPDVVLMATGSEVSLSLAAAKQLQGEGVKARVISLPCWERAAAMDAPDQDALFGGCDVRVAVEAGSAFGWAQWIGRDGVTVCLDHFGASAPAGALFESFGFTPENVAAVARQALSHAERA